MLNHIHPSINQLHPAVVHYKSPCQQHVKVIGYMHILCSTYNSNSMLEWFSLGIIIQCTVGEYHCPMYKLSSQGRTVKHYREPREVLVCVKYMTSLKWEFLLTPTLPV